MTCSQPSIVLAVDGTSASGKGTLAKKLAAFFDFAYLDTGALYRAVGLAVLRAGQDPADSAAALRVASALSPEALTLLTQDPQIRAEEVGRAASLVSTVGEIRTILLDLQRNFCVSPPEGKAGAVLDGRDIGTVIAPEARVKLFVTASAEARANRRFKELLARGENATEATVLAEMQARDKRDAERAVAPTKPAPDAILLDTTELSAEQAFQAALRIAKDKIGER